MALATYADLLTAIQNYEDDDSAVVTGIVADMVTLAEQRIFFGGGANPADPFYSEPLRVKSMERTAVIPIGTAIDGGTVGGTANAITLTPTTTPTLATGLIVKFTATASNTTATTLNVASTGTKDIRKGANRDALVAGDIISGAIYSVYYDGTYYVLLPSDGAAPLPANCLGIKNAYLQDRANVLTYQDQLAVNIYQDGSTADYPEFYAIEGDCLRFSPLPNASYKLVLTYYEKPSAISSAVNRIFNDAPGIYLFASLYELTDYLPSPERAATYFAKFRSALAGYQMAQNRAASTVGNTRVSFRGMP